ncbi:MAG: histidine kinase [Actinomycetes bacterium]
MGLVVAVALAVATGWLGERAARSEAVRDAQVTTELLARTVGQPALTNGIVGATAADLDQYDRLMRSRVLQGEVLRIKLWDAQGRIVYSDEARLIGQQFPLGSAEQRVLRSGGTDAEVSDLSKSENRYEKQLGRVLEVYTQVRAPDGDPLLFELYFSYEDVARRTDEVLGAFRPITVGGILLFLALTAPLVWLLARRLDDAASDRERLLLAAAQASDAERRRIARDLHDGVVQDLAGTSFALSATAREVGNSLASDPQRLRQTLESLAHGVRRSLRSLRSLLVEIYPPDLSGASLPSALDDLLAPAAAEGVEVTLDVPDTSELPEELVALVWRAAQECIRNALKHGRPQMLAVSVAVTDIGRPPRKQVRLEVSDDGRGFDVTGSGEDDQFGLRGLRDLVAEVRGAMQVTSAPGEGTSVVVEGSSP